MNSPAAAKQATYPPFPLLSPALHLPRAIPGSCRTSPSSVCPTVSIYSLVQETPTLQAPPGIPLSIPQGQPWQPSCRKCPHTLQPDTALPPPPGSLQAQLMASTSVSPPPEPPLYPWHPQKANLGHPWVFDNEEDGLSGGRRCKHTCWPSETLPQTFASSSHALPRSRAVGHMLGPPTPQACGSTPLSHSTG